MAGITAIEAQRLIRQLSYLTARLNEIDAMLNGRAYINLVRLVNVLITNAKIASLSADKITSGQLSVTTDLYIGNPATGGYIQYDGPNTRIILHDGTNPRMVISTTIRISLPGYNALTDTNIDHFALYADADNVLIKEKTRGSVSIANGGNQSIAHGLAYIPYVLVFAEVDTDKWSMVLGDSSDYNANIELNTTNLIIRNSLGSTKTFKYYIFYDQIV